MAADLSARHHSAVLEVKSRLMAHFAGRFKKVIVFGSHAWGTPDADSDVDLCVVIDAATHRDRVAAIEIVADVAIDRLVPLSPLVFGTEELERQVSMEYRLAEDIVKQGTEL